VYNYFVGQVLAMVEGTLDNTRFEEFCRSLLGNKSYVLYTLDKVVAQAVKHLQVRYRSSLPVSVHSVVWSCVASCEVVLWRDLLVDPALQSCSNAHSHRYLSPDRLLTCYCFDALSGDGERRERHQAGRPVRLPPPQRAARGPRRVPRSRGVHPLSYDGGRVPHSGTLVMSVIVYRVCFCLYTHCSNLSRAMR
jgi:hypothetical protein